jgi:hypothetical protein
MKQIEDAFQPLPSRIVDGRYLTAISAAEKETVDSFYCLWKMRALYRDKEITDVGFKKVTGTNFPKDQQELFEKRGVVFSKKVERCPPIGGRDLSYKWASTIRCSVWRMSGGAWYVRTKANS